MPAPTWVLSTLPVSGNWYGVEYGGGRFIAWQNNSAVAAYTDDRGASWQQLTLPDTGTVTMKYFNGAWYHLNVYNGTTATLRKSTDGGITWTVQTLPNRGSTNPNYFWQHLFVVNNRMYLFHNGGSQNAYYTEDGINWVLFTAPTYGITMGMAYGNGVYVVHARQTVAYSTDGVTWTYATLPTSQNNNWFTLTFGNGRFVMLNYYDYTSAYSTDGATWTSFSSPRSYFDQMAYGSGTFIASARAEGAYSSDDGTTWTAAAPGTSSYMAIAYGDGAFIMVPSGSSGADNRAVRALYNRAPGTPSSISHGQPKAGESLMITTGGSTDPDGDAVTYVWERSTDVQNWTQIASGAALSIIDTVPTTGARVQYRVKAQDASGAVSAYRTGTATAIYYNQPPAAPASISYAAPKAGKVLAVTCTAVTDPDSDAVTYIWERSIDGGVYSQAGITAANVFNYTVPTAGTTLALRVKARDAKGNESGYRTGSMLTISYNKAPTISGADENRGTITAPFSYAYFVTDTDVGDKITVVEKLDDMILRTFTATSGTQYTAEIARAKWLALGNGDHTLTITATDADGASVARTITFARNTTRIAMARRMATDTVPAKVFLSIFPKVDTTTGASLVCQVCNNPYDDSPAWEDVSGEVNNLVHIFENITVATTPGVGYRFAITPPDGEQIVFVETVCRYA